MAEPVQQSYKLIDPSTLSGVDIQFDSSGLYKERVVRGAELTITLHAEKLRTNDIDQPYKEVLLSIQSGQLTLIPTKGESYTYYTGDFVVIPTGFTGQWISDGHGMLKYVSVEALK